jgi:hypothetical protein
MTYQSAVGAWVAAIGAAILLSSSAYARQPLLVLGDSDDPWEDFPAEYAEYQAQFDAARSAGMVDHDLACRGVEAYYIEPVYGQEHVESLQDNSVVPATAAALSELHDTLQARKVDDPTNWDGVDQAILNRVERFLRGDGPHQGMNAYLVRAFRWSDYATILAANNCGGWIRTVANFAAEDAEFVRGAAVVFSMEPPRGSAASWIKEIIYPDGWPEVATAPRSETVPQTTGE